MRKKYTKRYVQFNDLVFDHVDMITADDASVSFKRNETPYTFKHGDYSPHKQRMVVAESYTFSMTISLNMRRLPCEDRKFYTNFAVSELAKIGRLWAVRGDELMWAWAELDQFSERQDSKANALDIDVDVYIPEGIWHKADLQRTFLVPWDVCDAISCKGYKDPQPCVGGSVGCCNCADEEHDAGCCCECFDREMALCYHKGELARAYTCDGLGYRIVYDCEAAERLFNNLTHYIGQKLCTETSLIAGMIYSNSDLDSPYLKIKINGHSKNPEIAINGNTNIIEGEYDYLEIYPDGTILYKDDDVSKEASVSAWVVPKGNTYGWDIHPGNNRVRIDLHTADNCGPRCAYFELDPISL